MLNMPPRGREQDFPSTMGAWSVISQDLLLPQGSWARMCDLQPPQLHAVANMWSSAREGPVKRFSLGIMCPLPSWRCWQAQCCSLDWHCLLIAEPLVQRDRADGCGWVGGGGSRAVRTCIS